MTVAYAVLGSKKDGELLTELEYPAVLVSFAIDPKGELLGSLGYVPRYVMLDSGAFTAWGSGETIDIHALAEWAVARTEEHPSAELLNLDVIPGTPTRPPDRSELEDAVIGSAWNADQLRSHDLRVIEVYHLYEPLTVLDSIMARRRPGERIAFGGLARWTGGPGGPIKRRFCHAAFAHLTRDDGSVPAVHGLGVSPDSRQIGATQFPWASCDSTSWISMGRYGVGVTRAGRRLGGRSDSRAGNKVLAKLYSRRVLMAWADTGRFGPLWTSRGVMIRD